MVQDKAQGTSLSTIAKKWRQNDRKIKSLQDLLLCYFSGFRVVCIPDYTQRPDLLCDQYNALYEEIETASRKAQVHRKKVDLWLTGMQKAQYFEMAFNHFSESPDKPFDFIEAAFLTTPVGSDFTSHVLQFMLAVNRGSKYKSLSEFLQDVARHIATCILLDIYRTGRPYLSKLNPYMCNQWQFGS